MRHPLCIKSFMYSNEKKINSDLRNKVSQRITRNGSGVHVDYRRTAVGQKKTVSVSGATLWNLIPMNIRNSNPVVTFKSHVPTPLRAPITTWEQTQTFLIKNLTFVSSFVIDLSFILKVKCYRKTSIMFIIGEHGSR